MSWFSEDKVVGSSGENIKTKVMSVAEAIQQQINGNPRLQIVCNNIGTKDNPRLIEQLRESSSYKSESLANILDNQGRHQACNLDPENNFKEAYKRYANLSPERTEELQGPENTDFFAEKADYYKKKRPSHLR